MAVAALTFAVAMGAAAQDAEKAKALYEQARAEQDPARKIPLLEGSVAALATFEGHFALGEAQQAVGASAEAKKNLQRAFELAGTDKARAKAVFVLGEVALAEGSRQDAVTLMRRSLAYHPYPVVAERLKKVELESMSRPATAEEIAAALAGRSTRSFAVRPAVSLRIGFETGSAALSASGEGQARQLGLALTQPALAGMTFEIAGHSDKRGDPAANERLSKARAETVRSYLIKQFKVPAATLVAVGRGSRELLYPGDTDEEHALNRRVEVVVR